MKENKIIEIIVCLICICILLPIVIVGKYDRPSADDYSYSVYTHNVIKNGGNIFDVINAAGKTNIEFYNSWQGLYSSAFMLAFQPSIYGEKLYVLTPIIILVIAYLCLLWSTDIINKNFVKRSFIFSIMSSLVILTILILWLPSKVEGLYWFNGAMNYMPWIFTDILAISLLIKLYFYDNSEKSKKIMYYITILFSTLLSFFTSGGNHVTAFANILILFMATIYLIPRKRYYSIAPLIFSIIGFIIMYFAPGTAARQSCFIKQSIFSTIFATIKYCRLLLGEWINLSWILSLVLITPISLKIIEKNNNCFSKFPLKTIICSIIIICGMCCVPYYAMGSFGAGRVKNVIWIMFVICSIIIYTQILGFLICKNIIDLSKIEKSKYYEISIIGIYFVSLIGLFGISVFGSESTSLLAIKELKNGMAKKYCQEMDSRIEKYNDKNIKDVEVEELKNKSQLLFFSDLETDPNIWPNVDIARYYDKEKVYIKK